jgi:CO/xanthine dehydrogenase FAD-binding subunit
VPYLSFHTDYKKMQLAPDELIRAICLRRDFSGFLQYARKVGARNAQAISKVCIAALGRLRGGAMGGVNGGAIEEVRIALGSVATVPVRLTEVERLVKGRSVGPELVQLAGEATAAAIQPIDDIRSNARYRAAVARNLVAEFLLQLRGWEGTP